MSAPNIILHRMSALTLAPKTLSRGECGYSIAQRMRILTALAESEHGLLTHDLHARLDENGYSVPAYLIHLRRAGFVTSTIVRGKYGIPYCRWQLTEAGRAVVEAALSGP